MTAILANQILIFFVIDMAGKTNHQLNPQLDDLN